IENMRLFGRWSGRWMHDEALFQSALQPVLSKMDAMNVDGIIYVGGHEHTVNKLESVNNLPIVMSYAIAADQKIPTFRLDDVSGGYDVTKYLVSKGHKRIGIIAGEKDNTHTINRIIGIQKAMFEEGILFDPSLVEYSTWNKQGGYNGMKALMDKNVTAVFCMSDAIAAGTYSFLKENGLTPGEDISVMGYDNQEISSYLTPEVTTMALPLEEIGYAAADKIIEMVTSPYNAKDEVTDIRIKSKLIERKSVKSI
ncbi:MAG: substrate-binding domain-containing protein, partial [Lachnospiraceae bacterium]|nr:substrate-binding domain-containing protein [Lachnospiraceae bacterium]